MGGYRGPAPPQGPFGGRLRHSSAPDRCLKAPSPPWLCLRDPSAPRRTSVPSGTAPPPQGSFAGPHRRRLRALLPQHLHLSALRRRLFGSHNPPQEALCLHRPLQSQPPGTPVQQTMQTMPPPSMGPHSAPEQLGEDFQSLSMSTAPGSLDPGVDVPRLLDGDEEPAKVIESYPLNCNPRYFRLTTHTIPSFQSPLQVAFAPWGRPLAESPDGSKCQ